LLQQEDTLGTPPVGSDGHVKQKYFCTFGYLPLVIAKISEADIRVMFFSNKFSANRSGTIVCATKNIH